MTLPVSGAISFNAINVELGVAGTTTASLNQASYRALAGVPSGAISLSNFYGKSNVPDYGIFTGGVQASPNGMIVNKYTFSNNTVSSGTSFSTYAANASGTSSTSVGYRLGGIISGSINLFTSKYVYSSNSASAGGNLSVARARAGSGGNSSFGIMGAGAAGGVSYTTGTEKYTYSSDTSAASTALTQAVGSDVSSFANASYCNFGGAATGNNNNLTSSTYTNSNATTANGGNRVYGVYQNYGLIGTSTFGVMAGYSVFNGQTYVQTIYNYVQRYTWSSQTCAATTAISSNSVNTMCATGNSTVGVIISGQYGAAPSTTSPAASPTITLVNTYSANTWASGTAIAYQQTGASGFGALMCTLQ